MKNAIHAAARLAAALAVLLPPAVYGCPLCHSRTGDQIRAGILNGSFGANLLAVALPFPVFAGIVAWLYFGKPGQRTGKKDQ